MHLAARDQIMGKEEISRLKSDLNRNLRRHDIQVLTDAVSTYSES